MSSSRKRRHDTSQQTDRYRAQLETGLPNDMKLLRPRQSEWLEPSTEGSSQFEILNLIEGGSYGTVYRARDVRSGQIVALKKIKRVPQEQLGLEGGMSVTTLRETSMKQLDHPNIVRLLQVVTDAEDTSLVLEFVEHDLGHVLKSKTGPFLASEVKMLMSQLLEALDAMHSHWIMHRDLKPANILLSNRGILKVADFGLARKFSRAPPSAAVYPSSGESQPERKPFSSKTEEARPALTATVVTLWYRAPELLAGAAAYDCAIDVWAAGCIFAEMVTKGAVLFPGSTELNQLQLIFERLGPPTEESWPWFFRLKNSKEIYSKAVARRHHHVLPHTLLTSRIKAAILERSSGEAADISDAGIELISNMLALDPEQRISAREALQHRYFKEAPPAKNPSHFPSFPSRQGCST